MHWLRRTVAAEDRLVVDLGIACARHHDVTVRNVKAKRLQCEKIWAFNYCKKVALPHANAAPEKAGDVWTCTAADADSKLIVSYLVGDRGGEHALEFIGDLASRLVDRPQITTDRLASYVSAIDEIFGVDVDFAQLIKTYSEVPDVGHERKYSPGICTGAFARQVVSKPDPKHVSASLLESHNQKLRQHNRRLTRLTYGHSKKHVNHCCHLAIYFTFYNPGSQHPSVYVIEEKRFC